MNADICNDEECQLCIVEEKGWQVVLGHSPACGAFLSERLDLQDSALALVLPSLPERQISEWDSQLDSVLVSVQQGPQRCLGPAQLRLQKPLQPSCPSQLPGTLVTTVWPCCRSGHWKTNCCGLD